jgi:hypothetical protein
MDVQWTTEEESRRYGVATSVRGTSSYFLVVEQLPEKISWDWVIWRRGVVPDSVRRGAALSVSQAQEEAVVALAQLAGE